MKRLLNIHTLQQKLILAFLLTSSLIFITNLFLFLNINSAIRRIDSVYESNVQINTLSDAIAQVQNSLVSYLDTKSTSSLESYFKYEEDYQSLLNDLNTQTTDSSIDIMQKNIRSLSETYLSVTETTMQAKRGRNIQKYKDSYEKSATLYGYINTYIYSLNNTEFKYNAASYSTLRNSFRALETVSFLILILVTFVNLILITILTRSITGSLHQLVNNANQISAGDFNVPELEVTSHDEIGIVSSAFNQMIISIRGYIDQLRTSMELESQLKEKELLMDSHLKEAELKYLQAQINPHFLFNTLNAGAQLAMMENANITYDYLQNVASFFRYKINRDKQIATLADEIALVDNYLFIINVRFAGDIHYEKRIDYDLTDITVPSMILQPIVENAINHGLRDITWEHKLILTIYKIGQEVCISIKDNGRGMEPDLMESLRNGTYQHDPKSKGNGVGLINVAERLRLFYNTEDVLDITSGGPDKGTEVMLYLPLEEPHQ